MSSFRSTLSRAAPGASAGLLAAFTALAAAELTAGAVRPAAGPVTVVGGAVIDRTPATVKDFAIRTFGEDDQTVLQLGILVLLSVFAIALGPLALHHRRAATAGVLVFGIVGASAALGRPDSTGAADALPSLAGAITGALVLYVLVGKVPRAAPDSGGASTGGAFSRRGFLTAAAATAAAATGAGALGRFLSGRRGQGAVASREALVLPRPSSPASGLPAGLRTKVPGISPLTTPNRDFYRVDTALSVPRTDAGAWRLRIHGRGVTRPRTWTLGQPDGRGAMLAVGMNGEPLPFDHGFPVRMLVPGLYGYVSACQWITDIERTTFDAYDPYWVRRKWARRAPVKTQARIDTPKPFARLTAGTVPAAGVAWAQRRGISRVEVRIDDGPWREADLAAQGTVDTWRQWSCPWQATPGGHTISVRATDGTGALQTEERARTVPDGASGRHSVFVTVPQTTGPASEAGPAAPSRDRRTPRRTYRPRSAQT